MCVTATAFHSTDENTHTVQEVYLKAKRKEQRQRRLSNSKREPRNSNLGKTLESVGLGLFSTLSW